MLNPLAPIIHSIGIGVKQTVSQLTDLTHYDQAQLKLKFEDLQRDKTYLISKTFNLGTYSDDCYSVLQVNLSGQQH